MALASVAALAGSAFTDDLTDEQITSLVTGETSDTTVVDTIEIDTVIDTEIVDGIEGDATFEEVLAEIAADEVETSANITEVTLVEQSAPATAFDTSLFTRFSLDATSWKIAQMVHSIAFIKLTKKDVTICVYDYFFGEVAVTKFNKDLVTKALTPVKSEVYNWAETGNTKCVRKGAGARASAPMGERTARLFRATASIADMNVVSSVSVFKKYMPLVIQAESTDVVYDFIDTLRDECRTEGVALNRVNKQLCSITIKNDPLYTTFDAELWDELSDLFTVTSPIFPEWVSLVFNTRSSLLEAIKEAKADSSLDTNSSLIECIMNDVEAKSAYFTPKAFLREFVKELTPEKFGKAFALAVSAYIVFKVKNGLCSSQNDQTKNSKN